MRKDILKDKKKMLKEYQILNNRGIVDVNSPKLLWNLWEEMSKNVF